MRKYFRFNTFQIWLTFFSKNELLNTYCFFSIIFWKTKEETSTLKHSFAISVQSKSIISNSPFHYIIFSTKNNQYKFKLI